MSPFGTLQRSCRAMELAISMKNEQNFHVHSLKPHASGSYLEAFRSPFKLSVRDGPDYCFANE